MRELRDEDATIAFFSPPPARAARGGGGAAVGAASSPRSPLAASLLSPPPPPTPPHRCAGGGGNIRAEPRSHSTPPASGGIRPASCRRRWAQSIAPSGRHGPLRAA